MKFKRDEMVRLVTLPLSEDEYQRLKLLAKAKGQDLQGILIQAVRLYDCVDSGHAELVFKPDPNFYKEDYCQDVHDHGLSECEDSCVSDGTECCVDNDVDVGPPKFVEVNGTKYELDTDVETYMSDRLVLGGVSYKKCKVAKMDSHRTWIES